MKMQCDRDTLTQTHIKIFNIYMSSFERYSILIYTIENRERWRYWTQCNRDTQSHTQAKQNALKKIWINLLGLFNLQMLDTLLITIQFTDEIYRRTSFPFISPKQGHIHYCSSFSCVCLFGLLNRPPAPAGRSGLFGDEFSAGTTAREAGALLII